MALLVKMVKALTESIRTQQENIGRLTDTASAMQGQLKQLLDQRGPMVARAPELSVPSAPEGTILRGPSTSSNSAPIPEVEDLDFGGL